LAEKAAKKKKERNDRLLVQRMVQAEKGGRIFRPKRLRTRRLAANPSPYMKKRMQAMDQVKEDVKKQAGEATKAFPRAQDEDRICRRSSLEDKVRWLIKTCERLVGVPEKSIHQIWWITKTCHELLGILEKSEMEIDENARDLEELSCSIRRLQVEADEDDIAWLSIAHFMRAVRISRPYILSQQCGLGSEP